MKYLLLIVLDLFCLCIHSIYASDYLSHTLTKSEGLSDMYVRDVVQDNDKGYLWFSTLYGLNRYDGYMMRSVISPEAIQKGDIPDNRVFTAHPWGKLYLWLKLRGNIFACYDIRANRFVYHTNLDGYTYEKLFLADAHVAWFYDSEHGCLRVVCKKGEMKRLFLNVKNGLLPSNHVNFVQTGLGGKTWISTTRGLVCHENEKSRIVDAKHNVVAMVKHGGCEYFITAQGLVLTYRNHKLYGLSPTKLPMNVVAKNAMMYRQLILLTTSAGVYEYDIKNRALRPSQQIQAQNAHIVIDNRNHSVMMNERGKVYYFVGSDRYVYTQLPYAYTSNIKNLNMHVVTTMSGQVMIATNGFGLFQFNPATRMSDGYVQSSLYPTASRYIMDIYEDRLGNIWIPQEDLGVLCLNRVNLIGHFLPLVTQKPGDSGFDQHANTVRMLRKLADGKVYVASLTDKVGMLVGSRLENMTTRYGSVLSVEIDRLGRYWWGARDGVFVGDRHYVPDKNISTSISSNKVSDILCDSKGRVWLACYGGGLDLAHSKGGKTGETTFSHFFTQSREIKGARVLLQDHRGMIWLGTGEGVFVFDPDQMAKGNKKYIHLVTNRNPKMDEIHGIFEDNQHRVWVAITGTGVALYDNTGSTPKLRRVFRRMDGLSDNMAQAIVADRQGKIWVGTNDGVSRFDEVSQRFKSYRMSLDILGNKCMENSACLLDNGMLAFGTKAGIAYFDPARLPRCEQQEQVAITSLSVNGTDAGEYLQGKMLLEEETVCLSHSQNSLMFTFSDFSFDVNHSSLYSYKMDGVDKKWSVPSKESSATFRNLPPGDYTLHVRSCNVLGEWSKNEAVLHVEICPPLWATWYAYLFYLLVLSAIVCYVWNQWNNTRKLKEKLELEHRLTEFKMHFFAHVSHEFRTPLTVILGAMEHIREQGELPGHLKLPFSNMLRSTNKMKRLIDRLLDFTKMQEGRMQLQVEETEAVSFMRDIWGDFKLLAENKQICYQFSAFAKEQMTLMDRHKIDTIVSNLISNAIKYTPNGGKVTVVLSKDEKAGQLLVKVMDNGCGISKEKQRQLFSRFMQSAFAYDSMGIGLYLSHQLAQLHHGEISYEAQPDGGSIFTLRLPLSSTAYSDGELVQEKHGFFADEKKDKAWLANYKELQGKSLNDKMVLVVEDDADVMDFLCSELIHYFQLQKAGNGKEALELIQQKRPDLIISDVMMPVMNGYELSRKLKTNDELYDIPIILLTALNGENKKAKGYEAGADDYIEKPFSMKMLVSRSMQLMMQHDRMKASFAQMNVEEPKKVKAIIKVDRDKKFIDILNGWIIRHLDDPELNVDTLASSLSFGRSTFYAKVSALTGMTPNNYIRKIRFQEAKRLLEESNDTIAEIAYKTGFGNPNYFSKSFKKEYGVSPSTYRKGE